MLAQSRVVLAAGFGGLLPFMAPAGIDALSVLPQFRPSDQQIRSRHVSLNHQLMEYCERFEPMLRPGPAERRRWRSAILRDDALVERIGGHDRAPGRQHP